MARGFRFCLRCSLLFAEGASFNTKMQKKRAADKDDDDGDDSEKDSKRHRVRSCYFITI